jgi:Mlc titration factor MtfA (ptsG expression regulator)
MNIETGSAGGSFFTAKTPGSAAVELDPLKNARIALLFCLPVLELGIEWLDGFHEVLISGAVRR